MWSRSRSDVLALGIVGSYGYGRPRLGSDVDLILLTDDPASYGAWLGILSPVAPGRLIRHQQWGPVTEWRFRRPSGLHVELGVAPPSWADTNPLDPGTARVLADGLQIVHDPQDLLAQARDAVQQQPTGPRQPGALREPRPVRGYRG